MSSKWTSAFKQSLKRPTFKVVFVVLLLCAVGLNAAQSALNLVFRKAAVPLRHPDGLKALPARLGQWMAVPDARPLNADTEHELGTNMYLFRDYIDLDATVGGTDKVTKEADIKSMASMSERDVAEKLNEIGLKGNSNAIIRLALTYYTGKVDTVPHVPERCMVASGFQPTKFDKFEWHLGKSPTGAPRDVPVRFIDFEDQNNHGQAQNQCVTYFFQANGDYMDDPNAVRRRLQDLRTKSAYFAKIEILVLLPRLLDTALDAERQRENNREAASAAVQRFLTSALPEIEKILPDPAMFKTR